MLGCTLVFIGAAAVPACAINGKNLKNLPKALGKKPPVTGIKPEVRLPVTPRIPPTLAVPDVSHLTRAGNVALKLQRIVVPQVMPPNSHTSLMPENTLNAPKLMGTDIQEQMVERIQEIDLPSILGKRLVNIPQGYSEIWNTYPHIKMNFGEWVTSDTPDLILFRDVTSKYTGKKDIMQDPIMSAIIKKADEFFFIKQADGKIYIKKDSLILGHSYGEVLEKLQRNIHSNQIYLALRELPGFIELRQQQIKKSLLLIGSPEGALLADLEPQPDVTTQRTAEEIKFLVENLDPQNSLRQAVENMLQENGYISPAE